MKSGLGQMIDASAEMSLLAALVASPELTVQLDCGRFTLLDLFLVHLEQFIQFLSAQRSGDPTPIVLADPPKDLAATVKILSDLAAKREVHGTMRDGGKYVALRGLYVVKASRMSPESKAEAVELFTSLFREISLLESDDEFKVIFPGVSSAEGDSGLSAQKERGGSYPGQIDSVATTLGEGGETPGYGWSRVEDPGARGYSPIAESIQGGDLVTLAVEARLEAIEVNNMALAHELRKALAQGAFSTQHGERWPTADLTNSRRTLRAFAQIKPDVEGVSFLSPEEAAKWQPIIDERVSKLDDATADCLDIISSIWLRDAKHPSDTVTIEADDFLALRGRLKHKGGAGRRGGYSLELRKEIANQLQALKTTFIVVQEMKVTDPAQGRRGTYGKKQSIAMESPVIVVTGRGGQLTLAGDVDPFMWNVRLGDVFARFLFGAGRETALIAKKALEYDPYRQKWEKRLTRYFSYLWRVRQARGSFAEPVCIKTILDELCLSEGLRPGWVKDRLEKALDLLQADGIVKIWQYEDGTEVEGLVGKKGWFPLWLQSRITVEPPHQIVLHYGGIEAPAKPKGVAPVVIAVDAEQITLVRKGLGLSISSAAIEIGIDKATLSRIEAGGKNPGAETRAKLAAWLDRSGAGR